MSVDLPQPLAPADQAVAIAIGEFGRDLLEERFGPELHGDVECGEHIYPFEWRSPGLACASNSNRSDGARATTCASGSGDRDAMPRPAG